MFGFFEKRKTLVVDSLIGEKMSISGGLRFEGGLQINGKVAGDVISESQQSTLVIGPKAEIQGSVRAGSIICEGAIFGEVVVAGLVSVSKTGRITGDIAYKSIHVAEGAQILGRLTLSSHADVGASEESLQQETAPAAPSASRWPPGHVSD